MRLISPRSPLRRQAYLRLWIGQTISRFGDQFTIIALLWFVLQVTGSGVAVGLIILCFELPSLITGPLFGRLLDILQPRVLMAIDNLLRAVAIALIPAFYALGILQLWQIYALALCAGALSPVTLVGVRVLLPKLVPDDELDQANALSTLNLQFAYLVGPVAAGVFVAAVGGPWALFIDAASFVVMGLLMLTLPDFPRAQHADLERSTGGPSGFRALFARRDLRALTVLAAIFFFSYGPLEAALPVYNRVVLHAGATGYGLLWTGFGVGAVVGAVGTNVVARLPRPGLLLASIAILWGALLGPLVFLRQLPPAMLFLALAGCAWAPYAAIETSLLQRLIPEHMRGAVFGARTTLISAASPLGAALGGLLLGVTNAPVVIGLSALACVITGALGLAAPALRDLRRKTLEPGRDDIPVAARPG